MSYPLPTSPAGCRRSTPRRLALSIGALAALGFTAAPAVAQESTPAVVTASALNIRSGPGTGYRVLGSLRSGTQVTIIGRSDPWRRISFDGGRIAWAHGAYLREGARSGGTSNQAVVTASALNVRSGPGTGNTVLGQLASGALVSILGQSGSWRQIRFGNGTGWVSGDYLRPSTGGTNTGGTNTGGTNTGGTNTGGTNTGGTTTPDPNRPKSRAGFIQLPASGRGFYGYYRASARWGTPRLVYGLERIGGRYTGPGGAYGVGDISLENGGAISGHASHRAGIDVDVRPVRTDGARQPVTYQQSAYSRAETTKLLNLFAGELQLTNVFWNDARHGSRAPVQHWPNHDNHFHARIR